MEVRWVILSHLTHSDCGSPTIFKFELYTYITMPIITAAALGALTAHAMTSRRGRAGLRGTRSRTRTTRSRYAATRYRGRARRKVSKRVWQARARRELGSPRNYSTCKTATGYVATNVTKPNQQLHVANCIRIPPGTNINQRIRDAIIVSGVRIQFAARNLNGFTGFLNWAVVCPKDDNAVTQTQQDFFRDYTNDRSWNAGVATKTGLEWCQAAVNSDRFTVMRRGKVMLGANPSATTLSAISYNRDTEKAMDIYVKLGRTVHFDTQDPKPSTPFENVYFCYWFASPNGQAGLATGDGFLESTKIITYFREPKTG